MLQTDIKASVANSKGYYSAFLFYIFVRFFRILYLCSNIWNILFMILTYLLTFPKKRRKKIVKFQCRLQVNTNILPRHSWGYEIQPFIKVIFHSEVPIFLVFIRSTVDQHDVEDS